MMQLRGTMVSDKSLISLIKYFCCSSNDEDEEKEEDEDKDIC